MTTIPELRSKEWERDTTYYWDSVVFLVENRLYKVPRYYFANYSEIFGSTFDLPQGSASPEGQSDDHPFKLHGLTCSEFDSLLRVIYPMNTHAQLYSCLTFEDWTSILKLSTMWGMSDIRQLAVDNLSKCMALRRDPVEYIVLAKAYEVVAWLRHGYQELVKRTEPISPEEAERIGWVASIQIYQIREAALVKQAGNRGFVKYTGTLTDHDVSCHIERVFEKDFIAAKAASQRHLPDFY
ncbi:hypothetical protein BDZ89DRAFT_994726 [Hymenopellis radicata]|nr:hypothetical protein BDZ89DRAFT_994726 [Hymenopellis radicata]